MEFKERCASNIHNIVWLEGLVQRLIQSCNLFQHTPILQRKNWS